MAYIIDYKHYPLSGILAWLTRLWYNDFGSMHTSGTAWQEEMACRR